MEHWVFRGKLIRAGVGPVIVFLICSTTVLAQNTGKLAGRVMDADTGEGVAGANIILEGTTRGTSTDVEGYFFILGIPVGTYNVHASFIGYQSQRRTGVEINSGYTREISFEIEPGINLNEIVVAYERPLIQKDAIGVPKIITAEEITSLPVRGVTEVAKIHAGVISKEGEETLNVRGGRDSEVVYYIDGVRVLGRAGSALAVPQSAVQEQEILIGNISARYGDAMSGVINITTKAGAPTFFGSLEGLTSEGLDAYGYRLLSGTLGGPLIRNKLSFFVAGEFVDEVDSDPRAIGELYVSDALLDDLRAAPMAFKAEDEDGSSAFLPIPWSLADGAQLIVDNAGLPDISSGGLTFSDGTTIPVPEGVAASAIQLVPVIRAEHLPEGAFAISAAKRARARRNLSLSGNLTWSVFKNARLRLGGRYNTGAFDDIGSTRHLPFSPEVVRLAERDGYQVYATWTHHLSKATFYQVQVDVADRRGQTYDPRFGTDFDAFLRYGDIDDEVFATLRGYKAMHFVEEDHDGQMVRVPVYTNSYVDGNNVSSETTSGLVSLVGGRFNEYDKFHDRQVRLSTTMTTQLGLHLIEVGTEYEQRTERSWGLNAWRLARFVADGNPEGIAEDDRRLDPNGYASYDDIPLDILDSFVFNRYGYDLRGRDEVGGEDFEAFLDTDVAKPLAAYNIAPYEPIYYGGYVQDKLEFRDIVLNLGLRVDVFDNNTRVLQDLWARRPVVRAGDLDISAPPGIGDDFAVYFSGEKIVGYRDLGGNFYDAEGQLVDFSEILLRGLPRQTAPHMTEAMFADYAPQVTWMPRVGVSFPVTDQALFFASYGIVSQRPSTQTYASLNDLRDVGGFFVPNNGMVPEKTTKYEMGFRQRLGARSALTISGFFHQVDRLIHGKRIDGASPNGYVSIVNRDFGTVKGLEFGFDLRRTRGVALNANYTLSFAQGTGSAPLRDRTANFLAPLVFDQRHKMNMSLHYRLGSGEGPTLFGVKPLEHVGLNVLATVGSGFPYTRNFDTQGRPAGSPNGARQPWTNRVDLRLDRRFPLSGRDASVTAFLWVQNLFDTDNVQRVYGLTGLPDNDGFLATLGGEQFLQTRPPATETLYRHRVRLPTNYGIPRLVRLGARLDF